MRRARSTAPTNTTAATPTEAIRTTRRHLLGGHLRRGQTSERTASHARQRRGAARDGADPRRLLRVRRHRRARRPVLQLAVSGRRPAHRVRRRGRRADHRDRHDATTRRRRTRRQCRSSKQLSSGVLISYEGEGHTIYAQGVACVDDGRRRLFHRRHGSRVRPAVLTLDPSRRVLRALLRDRTRKEPDAHTPPRRRGGGPDRLRRSPCPAALCSPRWWTGARPPSPPTPMRRSRPSWSSSTSRTSPGRTAAVATTARRSRRPVDWAAPGRRADRARTLAAQGIRHLDGFAARSTPGARADRASTSRRDSCRRTACTPTTTSSGSTRAVSGARRRSSASPTTPIATR